MGNRCWDLSITAPSCLFFLLTLLSCTSVDPPGAAASFRKRSVPTWAPHRLQLLQGISTCSSRGSSMGCGVGVCSGMVLRGLPYLSSPRLQGNFCSGTWNTSSLLSPWCLHQGCFSPFFPPSLFTVVHNFYRLSTFYLRCHHLRCWAQLCPEIGQLEPAGTSCVWHEAVLVSPHRGCPAAPTASTWARAPNAPTYTQLNHLDLFTSTSLGLTIF